MTFSIITIGIQGLNSKVTLSIMTLRIMPLGIKNTQNNNKKICIRNNQLNHGLYAIMTSTREYTTWHYKTWYNDTLKITFLK